jgi:hypothetical protein
MLSLLSFSSTEHDVRLRRATRERLHPSTPPTPVALIWNRNRRTASHRDPKYLVLVGRPWPDHGEYWPTRLRTIPERRD